jgi:hypothetical protein
MTDPEVCTRILEAHGWNLEAAVHTALGMGDLRADNDEGTETPTHPRVCLVLGLGARHAAIQPANPRATCGVRILHSLTRISCET